MKLLESVSNKKRLLQDLEKVKKWFVFDEPFLKTFRIGVIFFAKSFEISELVKTTDSLTIVNCTDFLNWLESYKREALDNNTLSYVKPPVIQESLPSYLKRDIQFCIDLLFNPLLTKFLETLALHYKDDDFKIAWVDEGYKIVLDKSLFNLPYKKVLGKGQFNKAWKCWSNKLKVWTVLKPKLSFFDNNIMEMFANNPDIFPKTYYHNEKIMVQEWLIPYETHPNESVLLEKRKELLEVCKKGGYSTHNDYTRKYHPEIFVDTTPNPNWGWEILGWKDKEQTNPILGELKNFDPLWKID